MWRLLLAGLCLLAALAYGLAPNLGAGAGREPWATVVIPCAMVYGCNHVYLPAVVAPALTPIPGP